MDIPFNNKVGTKRYMAPELLDETINESMFDCWKMADVYSLGLVFWELGRRCRAPSRDADLDPGYQMPYHDNVNSDPSIEEMKEVVCDMKIRPQLPEQWETFEVNKHWGLDCRTLYSIISFQPLKVLAKVMRECWFENAAARLSALRIKKTLSALRDLHSLDTKDDVEKKIEAQG